MRFKKVVKELVRGLKSGRIVLTQEQRFRNYARESVAADLKRGYCVYCGETLTKENLPHICEERT